jgi:hypothetical protein
VKHPEDDTNASTYVRKYYNINIVKIMYIYMAVYVKQNKDHPLKIQDIFSLTKNLQNNSLGVFFYFLSSWQI